MAPMSVTDVVARLHGLYQKKSDTQQDQLPALRGLTPPQSVVDGLAPHSLDFDTMPQSLQHGLLWEAGYATTADGQALEFYTSCGLSTAEALSLSSLALQTCAVSSPMESDDDTAWLVFSDASPLPKVLTSLTDPSILSGAAAFVPCSRTHDESFCRPSPSSSTTAWLASYTQSVKTRPTDGIDTGSDAHISSAREVDSSPIISHHRVFDRRLDTANTSAGRGLSADFTTALYTLRAAGATLPRLEIRTGVPSDVLARLDAFHLPFKSLTGLLQRAILWDSGYAVVKSPDDSSSVVDVVPVYVKCGLRMANIAPDPSYFQLTGCPVQDCSTSNTSAEEAVYSLRARDCPMISDAKTVSAAGSALLAMSRCAVPNSVDSLDVPFAATTTVWALGNISTTEKSAVPRLRLQQHPSSTVTNKWYAIHSVPTEVSLGVCPPLPSFIIPCVTVDQASLHQEWCRPVQSELIGTWLRQEQHQEMALATLILMAGAILVALALDLFADRKPRLFRNARISASSMPSLTSSLFDAANEEPQEPSQAASDQTGWSSVRSAESVRSVD